MDVGVPRIGRFLRVALHCIASQPIAPRFMYRVRVPENVKNQEFTRCCSRNYSNQRQARVVQVRGSRANEVYQKLTGCVLNNFEPFLRTLWLKTRLLVVELLLFEV